MASSFIPAKRNFPVWKGSTFRYVLQWLDATEKEGHEIRKPHDLTGYTGVMQLEGPGQEVLFELTTENGGIKFSEPTEGIVELEINDADTASFEWKKAVYTLFLTEPSEPRERYGMITGVFTMSAPGVIQ